MTKYPNADTSPERLAEIANIFHKIEPRMRDVMNNPDSIFPAMRDLLAMLQEREHIRKEDNIPVVYRTPPGQASPLYAIYGTSSISYADVLEAQLHDQRWRVTSEEMPPEDAKVLVNENGNLADPFQFELAKWEKQYDGSIRWVETREYMHMDQPKLWRPL